MPREIAHDDPAMEPQAIASAASRAMAIPELLEVVLGDKALVSDNLQFRLVDRLWNATCRATILQSLLVREHKIRRDNYDGLACISQFILYNEPQLACHVKGLAVDLPNHYHPLDKAAQPSQRGDGWHLFTEILPHMDRLQDLKLRGSASRWFFALAPALEDLRSLNLTFGSDEYTDAMDNDICCSLAQCCNLQTLRVTYDLGHFDRPGRLEACSDFFKIAGKQLLKLSLFISGLGSECLRKVLTAIGSQCPHLKSLRLELTNCESGKLDTLKPLLTNTLQHLQLCVGEFSGLTELLQSLANPEFLPNLTTAPKLRDISNLGVSRQIPLAFFDELLHALDQRGTIANLAIMQAMIYDCYGKQIEGQR